MKIFSVVCFSLLFGASNGLEAQEMIQIAHEHQRDDQEGHESVGGNYHVFEIDEELVTLVFDTYANRMRLMSPTKVKLSDEPNNNVLLQAALEANFGTTLDVRYAINGGTIMAAYLHPLRELTEEQFRDALRQVTKAAKTFGTTYSAGSLMYYGPAVIRQEEDGTTTNSNEKNELDSVHEKVEIGPIKENLDISIEEHGDWEEPEEDGRWEEPDNKAYADDFANDYDEDIAWEVFHVDHLDGDYSYADDFVYDYEYDDDIGWEDFQANDSDGDDAHREEADKEKNTGDFFADIIADYEENDDHVGLEDEPSNVGVHVDHFDEKYEDAKIW